MKIKILLTLATIFLFGAANAQQKTLMSEDGDSGAFGGPFIEMSSINGQFGADVGGGGGIIYNGFFLGGYGQGAEFAELKSDNTDYSIKFNHGGLWLGYAYKRDNIIHPYTSVKIGWGKARLNARTEGVDNLSEKHFALLPELGAELNLNNTIHIVFSGGYRVVNGLEGSSVEAAGLSNDDLNGAFGKVTFRIGNF